MKRLSKSPLALAVVSSRQTKKHHAESENVAASPTSKTGARIRLSYGSVSVSVSVSVRDPQTEGDTGHEHGDGDDVA